MTIKSPRARAHLRFWTPEARDTEVRKALENVNAPEEVIRAIEGGKTKRTLEMKTRLLEIEQDL